MASKIGKNALNNDTQLINAILNKLGMINTDFPLIGQEKFLGQRALGNEFDYLGMAQRICRDVTNMILSEPVRIGTPSETINMLIEKDIFGRLSFNEIFGKNLNYMLGIGDMVMATYVDPTDGMMDINYIAGQNVIPITYNNHEVTELVGYQKDRVGEKMYVTMVGEKMFSRETYLFEFDGGQLLTINYGSPIGKQLCKGAKPVVNFNDKVPYKRFAGISTGLVAPKGIDTPFHNSFIGPLTYNERIKKDGEQINKEFDKSEKFVFLSPDLVRRSVNQLDENGQPINVKKADMKGGLFLGVDLAEDKAQEGVPQIRGAEYSNKLQFDLQLGTQAVGLGSEMYAINLPKIEMTATQTLLTHKDAFNTINNIKYSLSSGLKTIVFAMIQYGYEQGLIPEEEGALVSSTDAIDIEFDDGVFVNKDERIDLGIRILGSASTIPGMRNMDQYTFLTDFCKYSKNKARAIIDRCGGEYQQGFMIAMMQAEMAAGGSGEGGEPKE